MNLPTIYGIVMEEEYPSKIDNGHLAILDMEVRTDEDSGHILYRHHEKPMTSKLVMHSMSAQSYSCTKSVHKQEVIRRLLNSSVRLDWNQEVAPVITTYMSRLMKAGYDENFRKMILSRALSIYDKMQKDDLEGVRPLHRPREWQLEERRKNKIRKKHNWSTKGGHIAPIFVPPTPNRELARMLKEVADREMEAGVRFKVVETGGKTVEAALKLANPTETKGCTNRQIVGCGTAQSDLEKSKNVQTV